MKWMLLRKVTEEDTHLCTGLVKSLHQTFMFKSGDLQGCEREGRRGGRGGEGDGRGGGW